jgi:hypothetical protein
LKGFPADVGSRLSSEEDELTGAGNPRFTPAKASPSDPIIPASSVVVCCDWVVEVSSRSPAEAEIVAVGVVASPEGVSKLMVSKRRKRNES